MANRTEFAIVFLAAWPVWIWYVQRLTDHSDEPLGIVALVAVVLIRAYRLRSTQNAQPENRSSVQSWILLAILSAYCWSVVSAPHLVSAILAVAALGVCMNRSARMQPADWLLLFLSLPLVASLNFFVSYPLRFLICSISIFMLKLIGFSVKASGTCILWQQHIVEVDPPGTGIRMLWLAIFATVVAASLRKTRSLETAALIVCAAATAVLANAIRMCSLFFIESNTIAISPSWLPAARAGVDFAIFIIFSSTLAALIFAVPKALSGLKLPDFSAFKVPEIAAPKKHYAACLASACLLAAVIPAFNHPRPTSIANTNFRGWPQSFAGEKIKELPMSTKYRQFLASFPGKVALFSDERDRLILCRWITQPSRQVHRASDCYQAFGYDIKWLPVRTDETGNQWSVLEAKRGPETLIVRECIFDEGGHLWTDVSSWYWAAMLQKTSPPWWSYAVAEPGKGNESARRNGGKREFEL